MQEKLMFNALKNNKIYLIWLVGVITWNYAFPQATHKLFKLIETNNEYHI